MIIINHYWQQPDGTINVMSDFKGVYLLYSNPDSTMKTGIFALVAAFLCACLAQGQNTGVYSTGYTAIKNLESIANIEPYSNGGMGFDNRYEGIKGTREVFDSLYPAYLLLKGQDQWVSLKANMDVVDNKLLFLHPKTGDLLWIPSSMVKQLVVTDGRKELFFRTTAGLRFEKNEEIERFCQVLVDGPWCLIKVPYKQFIEANYKAPYSPQRTYDEYESRQKYYISGPDSLFRQINPGRKSLLKAFPSQKEAIGSSAINEKNAKSEEEYLISVIRKFR